MTITSFSRSNIESMRREVEAALAAVSAKHGLVIQVGRITYNASEFRCKLTAVPKTAVPANPLVSADPRRSIEAVALAQNGRWLLGPVDFSKVYTHPSLGRATVIGYAPKRHKYPFTVKTGAGRTLKITTQMAKALVANPVAVAA